MGKFYGAESLVRQQKVVKKEVMIDLINKCHKKQMNKQ